MIKKCKGCPKDLGKVDRKRKYCSDECKYKHWHNTKRSYYENNFSKIRIEEDIAPRLCIGAICRGNRLFNPTSKFNRICEKCAISIKSYSGSVL